VADIYQRYKQFQHFSKKCIIAHKMICFIMNVRWWRDFVVECRIGDRNVAKS